MTFFEFYDIPISFEIDQSVLKKSFLLNSKKYHPDFHTLSSPEEQEKALELSTLNNKVYNTLKDFDLRMQYILQTADVLDEEGKASLPQAFLMEMMDINESIMDLQMDFDSARQEEILKSIDAFESTLKESITQDLADYSGQKDFDLSRIKDYYLKKKYLRRIKDNLNQISPEV